MPEMLVETYFKCEVCGQEYDKREKAVACEEKDNAKADEDKFWSFFPTFHKSDNKYEDHCPDCGVLLVQFEKRNLGDHYEAGDIVYLSPESTEPFLKAKRCRPCLIKLKRRVVQAMCLLEDSEK